MNKYCLDLELAKELYKRGIIKDAEFWWTNHDEMKPMGDVGIIPRERRSEVVCGWDFDICPAPIAEDLMELLPEELPEEKWTNAQKLTIEKYYSFVVFYFGDSKSSNYPEDDITLGYVEDTKLSNALAKMLIWLDDEGYLKKEGA